VYETTTLDCSMEWKKVRASLLRAWTVILDKLLMSLCGELYRKYKHTKISESTKRVAEFSLAIALFDPNASYSCKFTPFTSNQRKKISICRAGDRFGTHIWALL